MSASGRRVQVVQMRAPSVRPGLKLRVAARRDGMRSRYWSFRSSASRPELFVAPEGLGQAIHFSLHENLEYWQYTVRLHGRIQRHQWQPPPISNGARRALTVEVRSGLIHIPVDDDRDLVDIYCVADEPENAILIELLVLDGDDGSAVWPLGDSAKLMAGLKLVDGRVGALVLSEWRPPDGDSQLTLPSTTEPLRSQIRSAAEVGQLGMLVIFRLDDGSPKLTDLRTAP